LEMTCLTNVSLCYLVLLAASISRFSFGFIHSSGVHERRLHLLQAKADDKKQTKEDPDALTKASWYAVEAFGKVFGSDVESQTASNTPPQSMEETLERIKEDNEREYFLSGQVDKLIYDEQCTFADPFVSFDGRERFVENLANLGSFITNYSAKPLNYKVEKNAVETKFMVKLELNLPWKPVLAWPWGVRCEIDPETNLICRHEESWDIEPWEV